MAIKLAIFKSESDSFQKYHSLLTEHHFEVNLVPTIDFEFKNQKELRTELNSPEKYQGIIFTSPRTVQSVHQAINGDQLHGDWLKKSNYCVGPTTWEKILSKLNINAKGKETGNAENLSDVIIADTLTEKNLLPFLFPCSSLKQDTLSRKLSEKNLSLHPIEVYQTVAHAELKSSLEKILQDSDTEQLVFFSPSGFNFTYGIVQEKNWTINEKKLIAIGPSTAKVITEKGFECKICASPTPESLLQAITSYKSSKNSKQND